MFKVKDWKFAEDDLIESITSKSQKLIVNKKSFSSRIQYPDNQNYNNFADNIDSCFDNIIQAKQVWNKEKNCNRFR